MSGNPAMHLSAFQEELARLMGKASTRSDEDPLVYLIDSYGARREISEIRLDFQPRSLEEAEADVRHPVVEIFQAASRC